MRILLAALTLLALAPLAAGHGAPVVLDVETHLIADEASDISYLWDGFDITNVYVREAFVKSTGQDGLIFRIFASGIPMIASEHTLQIESDLTGTIDLVTSDGQSWTSSHEIVETSVTTDETTQALNVNIQVFVPLDLTGTLGPVTARAFADAQMVDEAPGPLYLVGVPVDALGSGSRMVDSLDLDGPDGYTDSKLSYADGILKVEVENLITVTGQHIFVLSDVQPTTTSYTMDGTTTEGFAADVGPGTDPVFELGLDATRPFQVRVQSDLGGEERYWVAPDGRVQAMPFAEDDDGGALAEESPTVPLALLLIGLVVLVQRRR